MLHGRPVRLDDRLRVAQVLLRQEDQRQASGAAQRLGGRKPGIRGLAQPAARRVFIRGFRSGRKDSQ